MNPVPTITEVRSRADRDRVSDRSGDLNRAGALGPIRRALTGSRGAWWLGLGLVWIVGCLYFAHFLKRSWIPHDDGTLAQSAERVLHGELPHRDFSEVYTGGLSYFNALAFRVFGVRLLAIRYALFGIFVLWVPALYYAASRLGSTLAAVFATLFGIFWSVPQYPAAMPSWYNLFFATFGLAMLLRYLDSSQRRWLIAAGIATGLSILCKISGVFFAGAAVIFLVYESASRPLDGHDPHERLWPFRVVSSIPLLLALACVLLIGTSRHSWADVYHFAIPGIALIALSGRAVLRARTAVPMRLRRLAGTTAWFLAGLLLPVGAFLWVYVTRDAVPELLRGLFVLPLRRFQFAAWLPQSPAMIGPGLLVAAALCIDPGRFRRLSAGIVGTVLVLGILALSPPSAPYLSWISFASVSQSIPPMTLGMAFLLSRGDAGGLPSHTERARIMLVVAATAFCSLVQYPFAIGLYFCYIAPLVFLELIPVLRALPTAGAWRLRTVVAFYLVYSLLYLNPMPLAGLGGPLAKEDLAYLAPPRGGLLIGREQAAQYRDILSALREHGQGRVTYVGPDAPEIYFLAGLRNETPGIFDFLVADSVFYEHVLERLDRERAMVVVINNRPIHSPVLPPDVRSALSREFPLSREIGRFTVRWRQ